MSEENKPTVEDIKTYCIEHKVFTSTMISTYGTRILAKDPLLLEMVNKTITYRSPQEALYLIFTDRTEPPKCTCGTTLPFKTQDSTGSRYGKYCSYKCSNVLGGKADKVKAIQEKYGVDHYSKTDEYKRKFKETSIKNWGTENPNSSQEIKNKKKETFQEKYGVDNISQDRSTKEKIQKIRFDKTFDSFLESNRLEKLVTPLFKREDYKGIEAKYLWKCNTCDTEFSDHIMYGKIPKCPKCFAKYMGVSQIEIRLGNILKEKGIEIETNVWNRISKEIDIFIPEANLGIEVNGVYWHSEISGSKHPRYHLEKLQEAESKGIRLLQFWDYEVKEKSDIVVSIIDSVLKRNKTIQARKCSIRTIDLKTAQEFFESNHIQGHANGSIYIGLFDNEVLVQAVSFGKPRFDKKYDWELLRNATLVGHSVVGGFARLLSFFTKKETLDSKKPSIISYSDKRLFTGTIYEKSGFKFVKNTPPNYFYKKNGNVYSRHNFQKKRLKRVLETYDESLTEWENMQANGFDRFFDCGHKVWSLHS